MIIAIIIVIIIWKNINTNNKNKRSLLNDQNKRRRRRNSTVALAKSFCVLPSYLGSEGEKDISKKSTEKLSRTKNLTYPEKWLTAKDITFPSNRGSVSSFSVISIHSCFSEPDSFKRMRTRATDISMSFLWGSLSDKGSWTATGFRKYSAFITSSKAVYFLNRNWL